MPYIDPNLRPRFDGGIEVMKQRIETLDERQRDGALNYVISRLIRELYSDSYYELNRAMGVLACAQNEIYRRIVGPYEDRAIERNGDVFGGDHGSV